jgi:HSP20 family molecular chaperone IbpA
MTYSLHPIARADRSLFSEFSSIFDNFDEIFDDFDYSFQTTRFNVEETETDYIFIVSLLGFKKDEVEVELTPDCHLTVKATKKDVTKSNAHVERTILLSEDSIDSTSISGKLEDGILTVTIAKRVTPKVEPRKVTLE